MKNNIAPDEIISRQEGQLQVYEALVHLTPVQAKRIYDRYIIVRDFFNVPQERTARHLWRSSKGIGDGVPSKRFCGRRLGRKITKTANLSKFALLANL